MQPAVDKCQQCSVQLLTFVADGEFFLFSYHEINCVGLRVGIVTRLTTGKSGFGVPARQEAVSSPKFRGLLSNRPPVQWLPWIVSEGKAAGA
jgi:hypothetical protein